MGGAMHTTIGVVGKYFPREGGGGGGGGEGVVRVIAYRRQLRIPIMSYHELS